MMNKIEIKAQKLLLVEGNDDKGVFQKLVEEIKVNNIQIHSMGGRGNFRTANFKSIMNAPGFREVKSLGIVRDADESANNTFSSICTVLRELELPVPGRPLEITKGNLKIGVLIIPPSAGKGGIEDLCLSSIKEYTEMQCNDDYFNCLKQGLPINKFPKNLSKAKIQAFLASREESVPHLGIAVQKGYFPLEHDVFEDIKIFLKSL